jgi:hypothetical protein
MEHRFTPCTRLHDLLESQGDIEGLRGQHTELLQELSLDVSTVELLSSSRAFLTYVDLHAMLGSGDTVAWLTPQAAVARENEQVMENWGPWMSRTASMSMSTVKI